MNVFAFSHIILLCIDAIGMTSISITSRFSLEYMSYSITTFIQTFSAFIFCLLVFAFAYASNSAIRSDLSAKKEFVKANAIKLFFSGIGIVFVPIFCISLSNRYLPSIITSSSSPLVPFMLNVISIFGAMREPMTKKKMFSMIFVILGILIIAISYIIFSISSDNATNCLLVNLIIRFVGMTSISITLNKFSPIFAESNFLTTPLLQTIGSFIASLILLFVTDTPDNTISALKVLMKNPLEMCYPVIGGTAGIGLVLLVSLNLTRTIGNSVYSVVFYVSSFIVFFTEGVVFGELNALDPILLFIIVFGLMMHILSMILDFVSPIAPSRREERAHIHIMEQNTVAHNEDYEEVPIPYSSCSADYPEGISAEAFAAIPEIEEIIEEEE